MNKTRLDNELIDKSIENFPLKGQWKSFPLHKLEGNNGKLKWGKAKVIPNEGGVYAFSFPIEELNGATYMIDLDGPQKSVVEFWFSENDFPVIHSNHFLLYVGRTIKLNERLKQHFHRTRTATQVLYGMEKMFKTEFNHVKKMLLSSGVFYYLHLPREVNCANRDMIELGLCVKYRSPINIKSER